MGDERRKTNRYPFDAAVDVTDEQCVRAAEMLAAIVEQRGD